MGTIKYTVYYKDPKTKEKVEFMSYNRARNEPLKSLLKWFDYKVEEISLMKKIDAKDVSIRWTNTPSPIEYCYNSGVLWY